MLLLVALLWGATGAWITLRSHDVHSQESEDLALLAHIFAVQANRNLVNAERILDMLVPRLAEERADAARRHRLLRLTVQGLPFVHSALFIDAQGTLIGDSTTKEPHPIDLSDRDFFKTHQNNPSRNLFIGPPVVSRVTGKWTATISRSVITAEGAFAGVAAIGVDPEFFGEPFEAAKGLDLSALAMLGPDGRVLARHPVDETWLGRRPDFQFDNTQGSLTAISPIDGVLRRGAYEQTAQFGLMVMIGKESFLVPRRIWVETALILTIALLVSILLIIAGRSLRRRETEVQSAIRRSQHARDAAISEQRRFVSMASHEFRTPLAIIDGAAQRLEAITRDHADAGSKLARIRSSVAQMASIIDRTLSSATWPNCCRTALPGRVRRAPASISP